MSGEVPLATPHSPESIVVERSIHTFEGDACCLLTDTKVVELIFDGESLAPFESTLEWDLGGRNEVVEDDFGSPTPRKPNPLETAPPTKWLEDSPRPFPPSEPG